MCQHSSGPTISGSSCNSSQLTQHFCTTLAITPTHQKISIATQNECKPAVSASTLLSGMATCVLTVLLKTGADKGGLREGSAPTQTALSHPPALAGKGKLRGSVFLGYFHERSWVLFNSHRVHSSDSFLPCFVSRGWKALLKAQEVKNHLFQPPVTSGYFCDKLTQV